MLELEEQRKLEELENEREKSEELQKKFTAKGLASAFAKINEAMSELEAMEPNVERFTRVERNIKEALRCYREIYDQKKRQTTQKSILSFFNKAKSPSQTATSPSPTPSVSHPSTPGSPQPGPSHERDVNLVDPGPSSERNEDVDDPDAISESEIFEGFDL